LTLIQHELKGKISVIKEYGDLPPIKCYPDILNQVFMNLLVNACQSIPDKGEIRIMTGIEGDKVRIRIKDTGIGIPQENIGKIFDPGFTTKGVGVGTGLGLSIVYNIIEKHNGNIEVNSEVGKGTEFIISLPVDL